MISLGSLLAAVAALMLSLRKESRGSAADQAALSVKLDAISRGVEDIRVDLRAMQTSVSALETRVTRAEERCKSNTHRLDALERKEKEDE